MTFKVYYHVAWGIGKGQHSKRGWIEVTAETADEARAIATKRLTRRFRTPIRRHFRFQSPLRVFSPK